MLKLGYQKARAIKQEISNVYWAVLEELKKNPSIGADFIDTIMHLCRQAQLLADIAHAMALFATGSMKDLVEILELPADILGTLALFSKPYTTKNLCLFICSYLIFRNNGKDFPRNREYDAW